MSKSTTLLFFAQVVRVEKNRKSPTDERRRVDVHVLSFKGSDGEEYRKGFETRRGAALNLRLDVPHTHDALNRQKIQWR